MKAIRLAGAVLLLVMGSAAADPFDYSPSAQLRYEMKFGGPDAGANTQALRLAAGVARPASDGASTLEDRMIASASSAPLMSVIDTGYSFGSHETDLHLAGIDLTKRDANPALDARGERSWWSNNWGWVVVAGIAAVTIVAVTAIHDGTKNDNRYGGGGGSTNQCPGPVSVQNGNTCTRP